jgi:uncharacterized membrane protein HdeD (DUF308 family)
MMDITATTDRPVEPLVRYWWALLITGVGWIVFANVVLSFSFRTVFAVAVWAGLGMIGAGLGELVIAQMTAELRWLHVVLGVINIVIGVLALAWPGITFVALARLVAWVLILRGAFDIVFGLSTRASNDLWWLALITGVLQIVVAFWANRYPGVSVVLLVVWVGVGAVAKGVSDLILAFRMRALRN